MKRCIVVGQPNVGKTEFMLTFARYCGLSEVEITFMHPGGFSAKRLYPLQVAENELVCSNKHSTRCLQSIGVTLKSGKTMHKVIVIDTTGLEDGIHSEPDIRIAMAQTLRELERAHIVIHLMDAHRVSTEGAQSAISMTDFQIARYMDTKGNYFICANKMDLPISQDGLSAIRVSFPRSLVVGTSCITTEGMREVRRLVKSFL